jgi:hypothetical protein
VVELTFGLKPPRSIVHMSTRSIVHMSTTWLQNIPMHTKKLIAVGAGAMCWSIWLSWNGVVFDKTLICSFMQIIYRGTHWTRMWSLFQKEEKRSTLKDACRLLETLMMNIFTKHGWRFSNRLSYVSALVLWLIIVW